MLVMGYLLYDYAHNPWQIVMAGSNHTVINPSGEKFTGMLSGRLMCRQVPKEQPRKVPKRDVASSLYHKDPGVGHTPQIGSTWQIVDWPYGTATYPEKTRSPGPCTLIRGARALNTTSVPPNAN